MVARDPALNLVPRVLPERGATDIMGVTIETMPLHHDVPLTGFVIRHRGKTVANLTDTSPQVAPTVRELIRDCDLLIVNTPFMHVAPNHISVQQAIMLGQEVGARQLVLTHVSHVPQHQLTEVAAAHPLATIAHDGMIIEM